MPSSVPTPLAAAIGLVPTVLDGVRRLPGRAVQLPVLAVSHALTTLDASRRGYDDLAVRGERLLARLRGTSFEQFSDRVGDAAEDAVADVRSALRSAPSPVQAAERVVAAASAASAAVPAAGRAAGATARAATAPAQAVPSPVPAAATPAAQQPKGEPTPKAVEPNGTRVDTAATADVQQVVEQVVEQTAAAVGAEVPTHDALPLPDYDHMTLGSLRGRLRSLTVEQLVVLRAYEKSKADRLPVVTMLDNRIAKLSTDPAATPSAGAAPGTPTLSR